jgi:hypothetical protein
MLSYVRMTQWLEWLQNEQEVKTTMLTIIKNKVEKLFKNPIPDEYDDPEERGQPNKFIYEFTRMLIEAKLT